MNAPDLKLVDPATGELVDPGKCPRCEQAEQLMEEMNRKLKGALLEARSAREDRHSRLWASPRRPEVELLHALHHFATKASAGPTRRKRLDCKELEQGLATLSILGFRRCLEAVVGVVYDPGQSRPRKNGKRETYNTFELALRDSTKAEQFAGRTPNGWQPNPAAIADLAGVPEDWVRGLLEAP